MANSAGQECKIPLHEAFGQLEEEVSLINLTHEHACDVKVRRRNAPSSQHSVLATHVSLMMT
jgi:hypothetical protein